MYKEELTLKTLDMLRQEFSKEDNSKINFNQNRELISFKSAQATHRQAGEELMSLARTAGGNLSLTGSLKATKSEGTLHISQKPRQDSLPGQDLLLRPLPGIFISRAGKVNTENTSREDKRAM